jgi:hypothetical protein
MCISPNQSSASTRHGRWPLAVWSAAVLAAVGTLTTLVEAASLTFLFTFAVVCGLAFYQNAGARVITGFGALAGASASVALIARLIATNPLAIVFSAYCFSPLCSGVRCCSATLKRRSGMDDR